VLTADADRQRQSLMTGRLNHLHDMGLVTPAGGGVWVISGDLEATLRTTGRRGDIINSLSYDLDPSGQRHLIDDAGIHDGGLVAISNGAAPPDRRLVGQVLRRGLLG
jgi:hypothetical protein